MADIILWFGMVAAYLTIAAVPAAAIYLWLEGLKHPLYARPKRR